jgi:phytoene dehydrogenase-like protein
LEEGAIEYGHLDFYEACDYWSEMWEQVGMMANTTEERAMYDYEEYNYTAEYDDEYFEEFNYTAVFDDDYFEEYNYTAEYDDEYFVEYDDDYFEEYNYTAEYDDEYFVEYDDEYFEEYNYTAEFDSENFDQYVAESYNMWDLEMLYNMTNSLSDVPDADFAAWNAKLNELLPSPEDYLNYDEEDTECVDDMYAELEKNGWNWDLVDEAACYPADMDAYLASSDEYSKLYVYV